MLHNKATNRNSKTGQQTSSSLQETMANKSTVNQHIPITPIHSMLKELETRHIPSTENLHDQHYFINHMQIRPNSKQIPQESNKFLLLHEAANFDQ